MYYDDLPIWGFIGKVEKILHPGDRTEYMYYLFTHIHFDILYNGEAGHRGAALSLQPHCTTTPQACATESVAILVYIYALKILACSLQRVPRRPHCPEDYTIVPALAAFIA